MAIWPEERLREHVDAAGGRVRVDGAALLQAFKVRQPTERAGANVREWLAGVGVTMEPPVLRLDGEMILTTANGSFAPALSWDELEETRRPSVVAYASRLCPPEKIAEAADAAFALAATTANGGGPDVALLEATREEVADRTAHTAGGGRSFSRRSNTCAAMPKLLAGRASGKLSDADEETLDRHLLRCAPCRALEQRRAEAERAYQSLMPVAPAPKLDDLTSPLPSDDDGPPPADDWAPESLWLPEDDDRDTAERDAVVVPVAERARDKPHVVALAQAPPPPDEPDDDAEAAAPSPRRSDWTRRIAIAVFFVGFLLALDAILTVTWKEPVSAFLQAREQNRLEEELEEQEESVAHLSARDEGSLGQIKDANKRQDRRLSYYARNFARRAHDGSAVGRLRVEGMGEWVVVEGTNDADLRKAPGHYRETVMPGMRGTVAVAGHRTTYGAPFRKLDQLDAGDEITFTMPYGRFTYRVQGQKIVPAGESDATKQVDYNRLVLTACHPLYSAAQRIIVFARLEKKEPLGVAAQDEAADDPLTGVSPAERRAAARERARKRLKIMGKRLLGPGMKGRDVKMLQRMLGVPQTGTFDPLTEFAVRDFQQKHKLGADGRAGAATKRALARRPRPPSTPPTPPAVAPVPPKDADGDGEPDQPGDNPAQPGQQPQPGGATPPGAAGPPGAYVPPSGSGQ